MERYLYIKKLDQAERTMRKRSDLQRTDAGYHFSIGYLQQSPYHEKRNLGEYRQSGIKVNNPLELRRMQEDDVAVMRERYKPSPPGTMIIQLDAEKRKRKRYQQERQYAEQKAA